MHPEYFDYLILGDEHHGEVYSGVKTHRLAVRSKYPLAKHARSPAEEASGSQPRMVNYNVHEYPAQNGRFYMVATNYPLSDFDVEDALIKSRAHPVRA